MTNTGGLSVFINWKDIGASNPFKAETQPVWTQTTDQGNKWIEQRIRIDNPYRNFEVCSGYMSYFRELFLLDSQLHYAFLSHSFLCGFLNIV